MQSARPLNSLSAGFLPTSAPSLVLAKFLELHAVDVLRGQSVLELAAG